MTTAAASDNSELLGPTTPAAGDGCVIDHVQFPQNSDGTVQEDSIEQETALIPSSETPTAKEVKQKGCSCCRIVVVLFAMLTAMLILAGGLVYQQLLKKTAFVKCCN